MTSPSVIVISHAKDLNYNFKRSLLGGDFVTKTKSQNIFATVDYKISDSWKSQSVLTTAKNSARTWSMVILAKQYSNVT